MPLAWERIQAAPWFRDRVAIVLQHIIAQQADRGDDQPPPYPIKRGRKWFRLVRLEVEPDDPYNVRLWWPGVNPHLVTVISFMPDAEIHAVDVYDLDRIPTTEP
jgi:hypothetical protein